MALQIVIIGTGFAGVWSALSAQRLINLSNKDKDIEVTVIAPEPYIVIRPRLYEAHPGEMKQDLGDLFEKAKIKFIQGSVTAIHAEQHSLDVQTTTGSRENTQVSYDRLILATGSGVVRPQAVTGLKEHGFDVDTIKAAARLEAHLTNLQSLSDTSTPTVVVCGAGFTGIELAAELKGRLGEKNASRVILVESATELGPELGAGPRPVIKQALKELGVDVRLGNAVAAIDKTGVTLTSGERIDSQTVIWTAGQRASLLTQHVSGSKDRFGRLLVDPTLRVPSSEHIFATGDAAHAAADDKGHSALMSCQHALVLGRVSGHNAAADLLDEPMMEYSQPSYLCCLDLGSWGAVVCRGWEREVEFTGSLAKRVKCFINGTLIYPPKDVTEALEAANPVVPSGDDLLAYMVKAVS